MKRILIYMILFAAGLFFFNAGNSQTVTVAGGPWVYSLLASSITEAGNDFAISPVSADPHSTLSITVTANSQWRVYIARTAGTWNTNLTLSARRRTNGTGVGGAGQIAGGTAYMNLTTTATVFFNGRRSRTGIGIQYQVTGVSVTLPAATYQTTIVYTITSP